MLLNNILDAKFFTHSQSYIEKLFRRDLSVLTTSVSTGLILNLGLLSRFLPL